LYQIKLKSRARLAPKGLPFDKCAFFSHLIVVANRLQYANTLKLVARQRSESAGCFWDPGLWSRVL